MVCAIIYNYNIPVFIYLIIPHFIYALMQISINQLVILHRYKNIQQCLSMHSFLLSDLQRVMLHRYVQKLCIYITNQSKLAENVT